MQLPARTGARSRTEKRGWPKSGITKLDVVTPEAGAAVFDLSIRSSKGCREDPCAQFAALDPPVECACIQLAVAALAAPAARHSPRPVGDRTWLSGSRGGTCREAGVRFRQIPAVRALRAGECATMAG